MKKFTALLLVFVLALGMLAGCTSSGDGGADADAPKVVRFGHSYDASSLDPLDIYDDGSYIVVMNIGEGLTRGYGNELYPGIAESWDVSEDGLTYTFHLRESTWSDGTPLTAHDFVYTAQRALDPDSAYENAYGYYDFVNGEAAHMGEVPFEEVGVKALDDYTVQYTLNYPDSTFLYSVAGYSFYPLNQAKCEAEGAAYGTEADKVLTNGPFTCTEWIHESEIVITKNENYWNADSVKIDEVHFMVGAADTVARDLLLAGELDGACMTTNDDIAALESMLNSHVYDSGYYFCHLNCKGHDEEAGRFMSNANFRKALSYAIDRENILKIAKVTGQAADRISAPTLTTVSGRTWDEDYPVEGWPTTQQAGQAKAFLAAALDELGATIDDVPELRMLCFDSQSKMDKYQAMQDMYKQVLGIKTVIDPQPIQQLLTMADNGEFDFWLGGKTMEIPDWASEVGSEYDYTNASAVTGYENQTLTDYLNLCTRSQDMKDRENYLYEVEKIIIDDMTTLHLYWMQENLMTVPSLKGVELANGFGPYFGTAYFE